MKLALIIAFLSVFKIAFCQNGAIQVAVANSDSNIVTESVFVELTLDSQKISSGYRSFNKPFAFEKLAPGVYKLAIRQIGRRTDYYDSLIVLNEQTKELAITYPKPCQFIYSKGYKPKCPYGHTDNIIPIVYGTPDKHQMEKSKKGKNYLGGCIITNCDPRYFCRLHKIEI